MKFIIMDQVKNGDLFSEEFDDLQTAIKRAKTEWDGLSAHDKRRRESFFVLQSENPDMDAVDHLDGVVVWVAK